MLILQAFAYTLLLSCAVPFIKPRLPLPRSQQVTGSIPMRLLGRRKRLDIGSSEVENPVQRPTNKWKCFKSSAFWLLFCGVLLQGLGGFVPGTYLPCTSPSRIMSQVIGSLSSDSSVCHCDTLRRSRGNPLHRPE